MTTKEIIDLIFKDPSTPYKLFVINSRVGQAQLMRDMTIATTVSHITNRDVEKLVLPTIFQDFHNNISSLVRESIDAKEESKRRSPEQRPASSN